MDTKQSTILRNKRKRAAYDKFEKFFAESAWRLDTAVYLACRRQSLTTELFLEMCNEDAKLEGLNGPCDRFARNIQSRADAAIVSGQLKRLDGASIPGDETVWVEPREFLLWAKGEGCEVAVELIKLEEVDLIDKTRSSGKQRDGKNTQRANEYRFRTPNGTHWRDILFKIKDGESVTVTVDGRDKILDYKQMGMADGRNGKPKKSWILLNDFADDDTHTLQSPPHDNGKMRANMKVLKHALIETFDIDETPIVYDLDRRCWTPMFQIEPHETLTQIIANTRLEAHLW